MQLNVSGMKSEEPPTDRESLPPRRPLCAAGRGQASQFWGEVMTQYPMNAYCYTALFGWELAAFVETVEGTSRGEHSNTVYVFYAILLPGRVGTTY